LAVTKSKFYDWIHRYGKVNEHNAPIPRDFWLEEWERQAIIKFYLDNPLEGYRRLTFMMLDQDVVAISPSSTYRVLTKAKLLKKWNDKKSLKGTGFVQPLKPHEHWHVDVSYINLCGTFYYLCSFLDGCSRYIVHWEIREQMTEEDVEDHLAAGQREVPGSQAQSYLRQRAAVHRQRLQGVHPAVGHDPRPDLTVLPAVERKAGALSQDFQGGVHPS
jgi:putative transposase